MLKAPHAQCRIGAGVTQQRRSLLAASRRPAAVTAQAWSELPLRKATVLAGTPLKVSRAMPRPAGRQAQGSVPRARVRDPDADEDSATALKGPPSLMWKVLAALTYLIPWIDTIALGREVYHSFPSLLWLYFFPGPSVKVYYSSQFAPLVIFFLLFLTIVKNTKLHHFVRFNCMQAVMLDIVCMLFHIVRAYFPAEIRWSNLLLTFDKFAFIACMTTVVYCIYFTLRGKYADIPFVSESVYMQVDASEYA